MAELRLIGIDKSFGRTPALRGLDLTVRDGEFLVLLGPTGAGKTTTLRLVAGLEQPDTGRVLIAGEEVTRLPPAARDVAFVFQQYSLYPGHTVFDNLAFPLRSPRHRRPEAEIRQRVERVAELLRIGDKLGNKVTALSGGQMQRVAIGRALVRRPNAFLMDEPLSSLDAKLREDLRVELKRIQRERGATLLYVTHDQTEALTLADRIGVLEDGRLLQLASPRDIYTRPADIRVAQRLGSPPLNLVAPEVLGLDTGTGVARVGVRPEDLILGDILGDEGVAASVLQVEPLGAETVLLLELGGRRLHALAESDRLPRVGDNVRVRVRQQLNFDNHGRRLDHST